MVKNTYKNKLKGFSLFELLVTMGILMLLSLVVFPVATQKAQEDKLESYASRLVTDIYYQQQRSALKGLNEGIYLATSGYTLFEGETLLDATDTDVKQYPTNIRITSISLSSGDVIFFPAGEFKPTSYGTLVLTDGINLVRISINREGLIGYENI